MTIQERAEAYADSKIDHVLEATIVLKNPPLPEAYLAGATAELDRFCALLLERCRGKAFPVRAHPLAVSSTCEAVWVSDLESAIASARESLEGGK